MPPSTNYISSWDFDDSYNDDHSFDNKPEEDMPYLATIYNAPTDKKPLRMRGGYNNDDNNHRPNKPGIMRVETVEEFTTDNELSRTSEHTTETSTDTTLPYNPKTNAPDPDLITPSFRPLHRKMNIREIRVDLAKSTKVLNLSEYTAKM